jgi:hypothetical protein
MTSKTLLRISTLLFVVFFLGLGCSSKPTAWAKAQLSKAEIESKVKESGEFKEVHLTEAEGPGEQGEAKKYEGTGTGQDGHTYKVKATYAYKDNGGNGWHDFHWEADDSQGHHTSGAFKGSGGITI